LEDSISSAPGRGPAGERVVGGSNSTAGPVSALSHIVGALNNAKDDVVAVTRHIAEGVADEVVGAVQQPLTAGSTVVGAVREELLGPSHKTSVAFVTMTSEVAAATLARVHLSHLPFTLKASPAPDPRDILWQNITMSQSLRFRRQTIFTSIFVVFAIFWAAVVLPLAAVGSTSSSLYIFLGFAEGDTECTSESPMAAPCVYKYLTEYLPSIIQLGLLALIPVVVQSVATNFEGCKSNTEVQSVILSRYFLFQLANIFFTCGAGSLAVYADKIVNDPTSIPAQLANAFPLVGAYFIEFIIIKTFFGLLWELSRTWPAIQYLVARSVSNPRQWTKRSLRNAFMSFPEWLYGWVYPSLLSVMIISFTYCVITPVICPFALGFFLIAELVYKNQALYVYVNASEGGGFHWNPVFKRLMLGLLFSHVLFYGYLVAPGSTSSSATRGSALQYVSINILAFVDIGFMIFCYYSYEVPSSSIPLEAAAEKDRVTRQQADEARHSIATHSVEQHNFHRALYEQPALRADPVEPEPYTLDDTLYDLVKEPHSGKDEEGEGNGRTPRDSDVSFRDIAEDLSGYNRSSVGRSSDKAGGAERNAPSINMC